MVDEKADAPTEPTSISPAVSPAPMGNGNARDGSALANGHPGDAKEHGSLAIGHTSLGQNGVDASEYPSSYPAGAHGIPYRWRFLPNPLDDDQHDEVARRNALTWRRRLEYAEWVRRV
jgi:hypothetical protein